MKIKSNSDTIFLEKIKSIRFSFVLLFLGAITFLSYVDLTKTFFQQDEWQYFGANIYALSSQKPFINIVLPFGGQLTHFFPFGTLFFLGEYFFFKTDFLPYSIVSLGFQAVNSFLLFYLVKKISKKEIIAFASALLFAINSISHQAVTWVAAGIGTLPGTSFLLLSLIFFEKYLEKESHFRYFLISMLFLVISLLFKETTLFLFILYPLFWVIINFSQFKTKFAKAKKALLLLSFGGLFYFFLRLFFLFFNIRSSQPEIGDVSMVSLSIYIYRGITVPLKALSQSLFPANMIIKTAEKVVSLAYPQFMTSDNVPNPYLTQSIVVDLVSYFLAFLLLAISWFFSRLLFKKKEKRLAVVFLFSLIFIFASSFPFIFIPGKAGFFSLFEPRNLYLIVAGSSLWLVIIFYNLASFLSKRKKIIPLLTVVFLTPLLIFHSSSLRNDLRNLKEISQLRKTFLVKIKTDHSDLPDKVIFYIKSDRPYYGMPQEEKILPVQSGFGRMLMVWYQEEEKFPGCLYENQFLHDLLSEGYKYCNRRGFGYFRDYAKLKNVIKKYEIPLEHVIAYSWNGDTKEFSETTGRIRGQLNKDIKY